MRKMSNGDTETISEKALNSTKVGGVSALVLAGLSAIVPIVQTLSNSKVDTGIIIGMEALAAVLACVAAWIYTVDARIRANLAQTRRAAGKGPTVTVGMPFDVKLRGHPNEIEHVLAIRSDDGDKTEVLVAAPGGEPDWLPLEKVEMP
jgi:hypothetical protein